MAHILTHIDIAICHSQTLLGGLGLLPTTLLGFLDLAEFLDWGGSARRLIRSIVEMSLACERLVWFLVLQKKTR
jgi:hypothetical protein